LGTQQKSKAALKRGVLPKLLGYRLRVAQQAVFRDFAASVGELSPGRAGMLLLIEANRGITQSRLAEAVGIDRSTLVGVIDALQARGLLERRRGGDRRTNALWLTPSGRLAASRLRRRIARHEDRVASRLTPSERVQLLALLDKLSG